MGCGWLGYFLKDIKRKKTIFYFVKVNINILITARTKLPLNGLLLIII